MKAKLFILCILPILISCEANETSNENGNDILPEVATEEVEVISEEKISEPIPMEEPIEETAAEETEPNPVIESKVEVYEPGLLDSYESLFFERLEESGLGNYEDFRFLGGQEYRLYFYGGHSIPTFVLYEVRTDNQFTYMEVVEALGQMLDRLPLDLLHRIERIEIEQSVQQPNIRGNTLYVGNQHILNYYPSSRYLSYMIRDFVNQELEQLSESNPNWLEQTQSFYQLSERSVDDSSVDLKETFYAYMLQAVSLDHESLMTNSGLQERLELLTPSIRSDLELISNEPSQNKPAHALFEITAGGYYDVISEKDPTSLLNLSYQGIVTRYYEKLEMPDGCVHPLYCEDETNFIPSKQFQVHSYVAAYPEGKTVEFNITDNADEVRALEIAEFFAIVYGRMPVPMLRDLEAVFIEEGVSNVWGGPYHGWGTTLRNCGFCDVFEFEDIDELVLHELAHTSIDSRQQRYNHMTGQIEFKATGRISHEDWQLRAARLDGNKINEYTILSPNEDLAETIKYYASIRWFPESVTSLTKDVIESLLPNRIRVLDEILEE